MNFALKGSLKNINIKNEILAGITVAMTMIPESLSFAILAGLNPLIGLYGAFLMGLITSILGGRPGMVSGAAGATIIVMISLIKDYGVEYLFAAVILSGVLQILFGVFKLGKYITFIPQSVMYGFLNGLAVVIFTSQLEQLKTGDGSWLSGAPLYIMLGLIGITVLTILFFPKITKAIPPTLVAIIVTTLIVVFGGIDTKSVKDIANISGGFPSFHIPHLPINIETLKIIFPYSLVMCCVGLLESLLTGSIIDDITNTKGKPNKECVAQGVANITNGFFGGMGGCAMIAQSFVNINAGSRARLGAFVGAITILLIILFASPIIEKIPMAALVGVMMVVAVTTFKWSSLKIIRKMPKADVVVCILVTLITIVYHNLAVAVFAGIIIAALSFAWKCGQSIKIESDIKNGKEIFYIHGPLFFGATNKILNLIKPESIKQEEVYLDFSNSQIYDMTALETLNTLSQKFDQAGKKMYVSNLNAFSQNLINRADKLLSLRIKGAE